MENSLAQKLVDLDKKRYAIWNLFFAKFSEDVDDDCEYLINDIPCYLDTSGPCLLDDHIKSTSTIENCRNILDSSISYIFMLTTVIEDELKSDLKKLILEREKAKLLLDQESYDKVHPKVVQELKRLHSFFKRRELKAYISICMTPNDEATKIIENNLNSNLKSLLYNQKMSSKDNIEESNYKVMKEWEYLAKVVPEDFLITYAVDVTKSLNRLMIED